MKRRHSIINFLIIFLIFFFFAIPAGSELLWESDYGTLIHQDIAVSILGGVSSGATKYTIGFDFSFYGETFTELWINSIGIVSFGDSNLNWINQEIPSPQGVVNPVTNKPQPYERMKMVAPLWDYLLTNPDAKEDGSNNPDTGVWAKLTGTPGSRKLVLTWNDVSHFNLSGNPAPYFGSDTFQITFFEGNNDIVISYLDLSGVKSAEHSGGVTFANGNYVPNDYNGITIGVNAGDIDVPGDSDIIRGTQSLYGFVDNAFLPEGESFLYQYNPDYYGTGNGGYNVSTYDITPTAVNLSGFRAKPRRNKVIIKWKTKSEIDNEGFNVWRAEGKESEYLKLNGKLIPAKGNGSFAGAKYRYVDENAESGKKYYYKLEDIGSDGKSTFNKPKKANLRNHNNK